MYQEIQHITDAVYMEKGRSSFETPTFLLLFILQGSFDHLHEIHIALHLAYG